MAAALVVVLLAARLLMARRLEQPDVAVHRTWSCGYTATTPRMQYTSSSLGQMLVDLFAWVLRPHVVGPSRSSLFPRSRRFHSEVADLVLDHVVLPVARFGARAAAWVCSFQRRSIQFYLLYIFGTVLVLLLTW
jgi:hydrogenase-4 component B